jgi:hypothetical protein
LIEESINCRSGASVLPEPEPPLQPPVPLPVASPDAKKKERPREAGYREQCQARVKNDELGKLIVDHSALLSDLGFNQYVHTTPNQGDLLPNPSMVGNHPAFPFLERLAKHGVPMVESSVPWTEGERKQRLKRGPHKSCNEHLKFL